MRLILNPNTPVNRYDRLSSSELLLKAIQDIELQPLLGSEADFSLIAPPNIVVTGDKGHVAVHRWDAIADDSSRLAIFDDTAAMINARGNTSI